VKSAVVRQKYFSQNEISEIDDTKASIGYRYFVAKRGGGSGINPGVQGHRGLRFMLQRISQ